MRTTRLALFTLASTLSLAACSTAGSGDAPPPGAAPSPAAGTPAPGRPTGPKGPMPEAPPEAELGMQCDASLAQWAIGKVADEALADKVKADTRSDRARVIKPGMAVTMDYRVDRVNIEVDADGRVTTVRCG